MNTQSTLNHVEGGPSALRRATQKLVDDAKNLMSSAQAAINNLVAGPQMNFAGANAVPTTSTVYRAGVGDNGTKSTSPLLTRLATAMHLQRPGIETTATSGGTHFRSDLAGMGTNGTGIGIDGAQHNGNGQVTSARIARQT